MESTRYSLVKGERIVRSVLTSWLRDFEKVNVSCIYNVTSAATYSRLSDVGLAHERPKVRSGTDLKIMLGFDGP